MKQLNLSQAKLLSELVIPVQISLGEISLSAAELIDLRGGESFPIEIEREAPVSLTVAGEIIAKGKITKQDSEIYILVTEVFSSSLETESEINAIENEINKSENLI